MIVSPDQDKVQVKLDAYCHSCKQWYKLGLTPQGFHGEMWEWYGKHRDHDFEFLSPQRRLPLHFDDSVYMKAGVAPWWLDYRENANIKIAYAASATVTCTLSALASSGTFIAGREAVEVVNTTNLYIDYQLGVKITAGTTPTVDKEIRVYGWAALSDAPIRPDQMTGADAARNVTSAYLLDGALVLMGSTSNSATTNVVYYIKCLTVAEAFGHVPTRWGLYFAHSQVAALKTEAGSDHQIRQTGAYFTSV